MDTSTNEKPSSDPVCPVCCRSVAVADRVSAIENGRLVTRHILCTNGLGSESYELKIALRLLLYLNDILQARDVDWDFELLQEIERFVNRHKPRLEPDENLYSR